MVIETTVGTLFLDAAEKFPERTCVQYVNGSVSYSDALRRIAETAQHLQSLGFKRGDCVACYLEEQSPSIYFDLACGLLGVIPVPLSPLFSVDYLVEGIIKPLDARGVFTSTRHAPGLVERRFRPLAYMEGCEPCTDGVETLPDAPTISYDQALRYLRDQSASLTSNDVFMVQPTSGSTGLPKLVKRKQIAFLRYAHFVGDEIGPMEGPEPHRFLHVAALTHAFGWHMLTTTLRFGGVACLTTKIDTDASLEEIRNLDPTVIPILPRMQRSCQRQYLEGITKGLRGDRMFGPSAKVICSAGGPGDVAILESLQRQGLRIIEFYGSTEASLMAVTPKNGWRPGHAGRLVPDVEWKHTPEGELLVRSPGVTPGYVSDEDNRNNFTEDGFYRTGDNVEVGPDKYVRYIGRLRDVFNTSEGSNIYPGRIEDLIEALPWVEQAVLVGDRRPCMVALIVLRATEIDVHGDGSPVGFVSPKEGSEVYQEAGLDLAQVNGDLERVEHIVRFALFTEHFPSDVYGRVAAGKVRRDRNKLLERYTKQIEMLYNTGAGSFPDPTYVPGTDRRLRRRPGKDRRLRPRSR
jgi:long-chain acyl-CoA synthetase